VGGRDRGTALTALAPGRVGGDRTRGGWVVLFAPLSTAGTERPIHAVVPQPVDQQLMSAVLGAVVDSAVGRYAGAKLTVVEE